ncbi:MAG: TIGR01212 family radical SAM protein [Fibrobacteres bacterium]|nr:TIGR01212 family radical SAM protein [Fibrobacterota bacterium]
MADLVSTLGQELQRIHGQRVHKLALDTGFTCPNRDGTSGRGGCTFCNNDSFAPATRRKPPLDVQMSEGAQVVARRTGARKFLAYFQAYTNTYDDLPKLKALWRQALAFPGCVGISVGTRPDCLAPGVLEELARLQEAGAEVWLELGLQSAFDETLKLVNRGHGAEVYFQEAARARSLGLSVCAHLILGLPGERREHALESHRQVIEAGVDGLKIHPLHVVKGSLLAAQWRRSEYIPLSMSEYVSWTCDLVERTPPEVVFHRLTGTCEAQLLLSPLWCEKKWDVINGIESELRARAGPGGAVFFFFFFFFFRGTAW